MDFVSYEKIIKKGEKTEWYGVEVPKDLITTGVNIVAENLNDEINKLESTLDQLRGVSLEKRKSYIKTLRNNLQNCPYRLNGDFYLIKKNRIEEDLKTKTKTKKTKQK